MSRASAAENVTIKTTYLRAQNYDVFTNNGTLKGIFFIFRCPIPLFH